MKIQTIFAQLMQLYNKHAFIARCQDVNDFIIYYMSLDCLFFFTGRDTQI